MPFKVIQYDDLPDDLEQRLLENSDVTKVGSLGLMKEDEYRTVLAEAEGLIGVGQE